MRRYFAAVLMISVIAALSGTASSVEAYRKDNSFNRRSFSRSKAPASASRWRSTKKHTATPTQTPDPVTDPTPTTDTTTDPAPTTNTDPSTTTDPATTPTNTTDPATTDSNTNTDTSTTNPTTTPTSTTATTRTNPICISTHINELNNAEIDKQLDLAKTAGAYWIRYDFSWDQMQNSDGTWDFSKYDYIVNGISSRGMQTLALLTQYGIESSKRNGRGNMTPMTASEFGAFASKVSAHYKGKIKLYELGNEPNIDIFWNTGINVSEYTKLMIAGDTVISAQDPDAKTISAGIPPMANMETFLQGMYDAGAKGHFDYLGYHPYSTHASPDKDFGDMALARQIENKNGDNKPVIATEVGWSTATGGVSEADQATYTGRVYQKIMAEDFKYVDIACTYDLKNDGSDINDWESNFGMLRYDYSKKPVFAVMQAQRNYFNNNFK